MTHPAASIDDVVHQRTRLGVLAILRESTRMDFCALRDELGVTDGNLSQHLRVLEDASYVEVEKGYEGRRPRTWARATPAGNEALVKELKLLSRIISASGYDPAVEIVAAVDMGVDVEVPPPSEMPTAVQIGVPVGMSVSRPGQLARRLQHNAAQLVTRTG